ncbi:MAG TPA: family 10 glycosylhydrolase [Longimicrobium sp.]|nr:family 10 glycosylhydrolase [Longimicrobium sp.]
MRRTIPGAVALALFAAAASGAALAPRWAPLHASRADAALPAIRPAESPSVLPARTVLRAATKPARVEARALWVTRMDYGDSTTIKQVMRVASRANLNIVYFQVSGPWDARYPSALNPCSPRLCGRLGGVPAWDPLEVAVREAHAHGLQLHAWINALSGWESETSTVCRALVPSVPGQPNHVLVDHPEWAMHTQQGQPQRCPNDTDYVWLSPAYAGVRTHLARVAADVVRRYGVDGVHLDRVRYPEREYGNDAAALSEFGGDPRADPAGWNRFRAGLVSRLVREVHDSIHAVRPVPLSAAVWPIYDRDHFGWASSSGVRNFAQDTWGWARDGTLDVAVPMTYFRVTDPECTYLPLRPGGDPNPDWRCMIRDQVGGLHGAGRHLYAGIQATLPRAEIERQIRIGRELGADGFSFYFYSMFAETGLYSYLADGPFREPAQVPPMDWLR